MRTDARAVFLAAGIAVGLAALPAGAQGTRPHDPLHEMDWGRTTFLLSEVLELAPDAASRPVLYDLLAWTGDAIHRVWFKAEGEFATRGTDRTGEYQVLYGRMITPFWDVQLGVRADLASGGGASARRVGAIVGVQGLAPGWFELEPSLFVTTEGKASLDLTGSYDLYVTQRLVLQPRLETSLSSADDLDFGIGSGLSTGSFALRARYEVRREFAPYVGVLWERRFGRTADVTRAGGGEVGETLLVVGLRLWR